MTVSQLEAVAAEADQSVTMLKECRHGRMLFLRRDQYIGASLDLYGEFSELEGKLFSTLVRRNDVVIEVGANIGAHTVHLAKLAGPQGVVLAFEPQRIIFQLLCANLALNELFNVRAFHAAAGTAPGVLKVPNLDYAAAVNFGGLSLIGVASGEEVPVLPLDTLNVPSLRLLKVDVEGMETEVLAGAGRLIARHRPIIYVENDRQPHSERLIRLLQSYGYAMWWHLPALFNPTNHARQVRDIFPGIVSVNLLCMPSEIPITINGLRKVSGPADWWQHPSNPG